MKTYNINTVYEKINPLIEKNLSNEQKLEIKRLLKLSLPKNTKKSISLNFNFWLFKTFFITLYLSQEKRSEKRRFKFNKILEYCLVSLYSLFILFLILISISAIFLALYYIKSYLGINIFSFHLFD